MIHVGVFAGISGGRRLAVVEPNYELEFHALLHQVFRSQSRPNQGLEPFLTILNFTILLLMFIHREGGPQIGGNCAIGNIQVSFSILHDGFVSLTHHLS